MKQRLLLAFFALSLIFASCSSSDNLDGNWIKSSSFAGQARGGAVSFVIGDYVYVGTGYDGKDCLKNFYKYSLKTGWEKIAEFPGKERKEAVAFVVNGKGYVGTGVDDDDNRLKDFWEYTPGTNTWTKVANEFPGGARQGAIAFTINNVAYIGTGYGFLENDDRNNLKDFYKFENGTWTSTSYPGEKARNATAFVIKNKAYVVSGKKNLELEYVWEFDPAKVSANSDGWTRKKDLDDDNNWEDAKRSQAISFVISDKAYIATGINGTLSREVWEYNPAVDDWTEMTSLEREVASRVDAVAFTINNRGFFTTGTVSGSGTYYDDTWEFNPLMDEDEDDN
jgi:N-acetylneuraminic acid mutarotase